MSESTASLEGWPHTHIQGEPIDVIGLPIDIGFYSHSFDAITGNVNQTHDGTHIDSYSQVYRQTSPKHARSYEIDVKELEKGQYSGGPYWNDQYGNFYSALTTKGNNFTRPDILRSSTAPSGYIPYGLLESNSLLRVLRSSRVMRQAGIDTEWIVRIIEPKQLLFDKEPVDQETFKRKLLNQVIMAGLGESKSEANADEVAKISDALSSLSFFVTLRAMSIADRPADLTSDDAYSAKQRFARVFETLKYKSNLGELDANNSDHIKQFMGVILPKLLGANMAKLHNLGLAHSFPYTGNVNLLGGLVDLDSVRGECLNLGDKPVTNEDFAEDIRSLLHHPRQEDMNTAIQHLKTLGLVDDGDGVFHNFVDLFYESYFVSRHLNPKIRDDAVVILDIVTKHAYDMPKTIVNESLHSLIGDLDLDVFFHMPSFEALLKRLVVPQFASAIDSYIYATHENPRIDFFNLDSDKHLRIAGEVSAELVRQAIQGNITDKKVLGLANQCGIAFETAKLISGACYSSLLMENFVEYMTQSEEAQKLILRQLDTYGVNLHNRKEGDWIYRILNGLSLEEAIERQDVTVISLFGFNSLVKTGVSLPDLLEQLDHRIDKFRFSITEKYDVLTHYDEPEHIVMVVSDKPIIALGNKGDNPLLNSNNAISLGSDRMRVLTDSGEPSYIAYISSSTRPDRLNLAIQTFGIESLKHMINRSLKTHSNIRIAVSLASK